MQDLQWYKNLQAPANIVGDQQVLREGSRSPERQDEKASGVACRWNEKGFGFIKPDDGSEDLFCHHSNILDGNSLVEGTPVQFVKVFDERKGKERAEEVTGGATETFGSGGFGGEGFGGGRFGQRGYGAPAALTDAQIADKSTGVALRWNERGFGFIKPDDGGESLFCHSSNIEDGNALARDSRVAFIKVYDEAKGKERAEQVVGGIQEDRSGTVRYGGGGFHDSGNSGGGCGGGGGRWDRRW
mmetsp:Transcript_59945/g.99497  ORF Transcript_59945/g.99497 Transcript_59945/m.99497 type:complete len:243 (-) Transcript_59945:593-1321(-)